MVVRCGCGRVAELLHGRREGEREGRGERREEREERSPSSNEWTVKAS